MSNQNSGKNTVAARPLSSESPQAGTGIETVREASLENCPENSRETFLVTTLETSLETWTPRVFLALAAGLPLFFLTLFFLWPTARMIMLGLSGWTGLSGQGADTAPPLWEFLAKARTWKVTGWTLKMAAAGMGLSVVSGIAGAWVFYCLEFPGRRLLRALVTVPFVLPTVSVGVSFQTLLAPGGLFGFLGWQGTQAAIIAGMVFFNFSLVMRIVGSAWQRLDARPAQAARCLGATPARAFFTITLPALAPAIAGAGGLVFLYCVTSYGLVRVLGGVSATTLEAEIYTETAQFLNLRGAAVLSLLQLVIVGLTLAFTTWARRRSERSLRLAARLRPRRPSRADTVALLVAGVTSLFIAFPLGNMFVAGFRRGGQWTMHNFWDLARPGVAPGLHVSAWQAAGMSVYIALLSTVVSLLVGTGVSLVASRRPNSASARSLVSLFDGLFMVPLGVSAVTVGFGFLITLQSEPLNLSGTPWLLALSSAVVSIPLVVRSLVPTLRAINPRQKQAARALGATPARAAWTVEGPYLLRGLGVGAVFALTTALGEFGAASFLARPDSPTLPVAIFSLISHPSAAAQGTAAAGSALLAFLCATLILLAEAAANTKEKP